MRQTGADHPFKPAPPGGAADAGPSVAKGASMPTETFRSKVDTWLALLVGAAAILAIYAVGSAARAGAMSVVAAIALVLLSAGLPAWILASTRYELSDAWLVIRSGPFRWRIAISDIRSVVPTRNPHSSPALSLDRLRIEYGQGRAIMISPGDKGPFLRAIEERRRLAAQHHV